jgi:hypothetical protein
MIVVRAGLLVPQLACAWIGGGMKGELMRSAQIARGGSGGLGDSFDHFASFLRTNSANSESAKM